MVKHLAASPAILLSESLQKCTRSNILTECSLCVRLITGYEICEAAFLLVCHLAVNNGKGLLRPGESVWHCCFKDEELVPGMWFVNNWAFP